MKNLFTKLIAVTALVALFTGGAFESKAEEKKQKTESTQKSDGRKLPFHGKIAGVDKSAKTVTIGKRTFQLTSSTRVIKGDDSPATLDDAKTGEMASGSYVKKNDDTLELGMLRIGAKQKTDESKKKTL